MPTAPATKPEADAEEVAPTAAVPIQPTPTQAENDAFGTPTGRRHTAKAASVSVKARSERRPRGFAV